MKQSYGKIIATNRKKQNLSQPKLAEALKEYGHDISPRSISKWETEVYEPSISVFFDICKILGVTNIYEQYFGVNPADPLSQLNESGKQKALDYIQLLIKSGDYKKEPAKILPFTRKLPFYLQPVSAGPGNFLDEGYCDEISAGEDVPATADFAVKISGDSMEPEYHNNQVIWVHKQNTLKNGEIGIFFLDDNVYIKKLQKDENGTFLVSLNKNYAPIPVTEFGSFYIYGHVVG